MKINLQVTDSPDATPAEMTTSELWVAHTSRRIQRRALLPEQAELHAEITRREHLEHSAKMNPDASKDQAVRGK